MRFTLDNIVKQGVRSLGLGAAIALSCVPSAVSENHASQLKLANCGVYTIDWIMVQGKKDGQGWDDLYLIDKDLRQNNAMCIDVSQDNHPVDQYRLKVYISGGDTVRCDGTNYSYNTDRRSMTMKGAIRTNNGCRSNGCRELSESCAKQGALREISC